MFEPKKIKDFFTNIKEEKENQCTTHIANGLIYNLIYIEYQEVDISFESMVTWLIYHQIKYYNLNEFNIKIRHC